jgi:hypothetical protein
VVIGSGATAVTLVPEMAKTAGHVTMLQRSPTYVVSRPAEDPIANWLRAKLPAMTAYGITRWKNVLMQMLFFNVARKKPEKTKAQLIGMVREHLGPDYDVAYALHAPLQSLGPAPVPGARRRPVRGAEGRLGLGGHRPYRDLHADRHPKLQSGATGRRRHRHRHRPEACSC